MGSHGTYNTHYKQTCCTFIPQVPFHSFLHETQWAGITDTWYTSARESAHKHAPSRAHTIHKIGSRRTPMERIQGNTPLYAVV